MDNILNIVVNLCKSNNYSSQTFSLLQKIEKQSGWDRLEDISVENSVLPVVYKNIEQNYSNFVPAYTLSKLKKTYHQISINNINKAKQLADICNRLSENNIEVLTFKGPVAAFLSYGSVTGRQYSDIDLMIDRKDADNAKVQLNRMGYTPIYSIGDNTRNFYLDHWYYEIYYSEDARNTVDLHWRTEKSCYSYSIGFSVFNSNSFPVELYNTPIHTPCSELNLIFLCQHGCKHAWEQLVWILDLHKHIESSVNLDWDLTLKIAEDHNCLKMLKTGLLISMKMFDTKIPKKVEQLIYNDSWIIQFTENFIEGFYGSSFNDSGYLFLKHVDIFYLNTMDSYRDRIMYLLSFLSITPIEMQKELPKYLHFLYYFRRAFRLIKRNLLK